MLNKKGFTLLEMIVGISLSLVITVMITTIIMMQIKMSDELKNRYMDQYKLQNAAEEISRFDLSNYPKEIYKDEEVSIVAMIISHIHGGEILIIELHNTTRKDVLILELFKPKEESF